MSRSVTIAILVILSPSLAEPGELTASARYRYSTEMTANAAAIARSTQAVVITSDEIDPVARFQLERGPHRFCLDGGHEYFAGVVLEDSVGTVIPARMEHDGCSSAALPAGAYTLRPVRATAARPVPAVSTVVTADLPTPPLLTPQRRPRLGYWAIYPPANDTNQLPAVGRLRASAPYRNVDVFPNPFPQAMPVYADYSTPQMDEYSLFQLNQPSPAILAGPAGSFLDFSDAGPIPVSTAGTVVVSQQCTSGPATCNNFSGDPMRVVDLQSASSFQLVRSSTDRGAESIHFGLVNQPVANAINVIGRCFFCSNTATFALVFRFFPDGTQMGPLYPGEIALFQQANYKGKATVFPASTANIGDLASAATTIDKAVVSIKLGANTMATVYPLQNYGGVGKIIIANDELIDDITQVGSIRLGSLTAYMLSTHACDNCNFQGVDLSGLNLTGFSLNNAKFGGAILTNTKFDGASLAGADFTGAKINCTDFSGTDANHLNDVTQTTFTNIQLAAPTTCRMNFSYVKLLSRTIPPTLWKSVNLTGAEFTDLPGKVLSSQTQPLDLTGAILTGASLQGAILDYATGIPGAAVTGIILDGGSLKGCNLQKAVLDGASMQTVDLTGATLAGASLDHTVLDRAIGIGKIDFASLILNYTSFRYIDLSGNDLKGKNLQTVILDEVTGLSGADLSLIQLNRASLKHVNLSQAVLKGAHLNHANLDGANLSGANLERSDGENGTVGDLTGAFLRNVNLSQGKISGAKFNNASFYSKSAVGTGTCPPDSTTGFTSNCATASGATMDGTDFSSAYLFGVDFTSATAVGVNFGGSFLAGSNFSQASLTTDSSGDNTGFSNAFLQGTSLIDATMPTGLSLDSAFVDFSSGNTIALVLSGEHTLFAGYWGTPGNSVCARMEYPGPTTVATNDPRMTCPDGKQHSGGCGAPSPDGTNSNWASGVSLQGTASYRNAPTYSNPKDNSSVCSFDLRWVPFP